MRNLTVNDTTTGGLKLEVSPNDVVLSAGVFGDTEVATLSRTSSSSKSSTIFLHEDEKGRIEQSFDLMPSGEVGVLIWRNYDWRKPDSRIPVNMSVHVCNKQ